eukprot:UN07855
MLIHNIPLSFHQHINLVENASPEPLALLDNVLTALLDCIVLVAQGSVVPRILTVYLLNQVISRLKYRAIIHR